MTEQQLSNDEKLQAAIENYARISAETAYQRHGGQSEKFDDYYQDFVKTAKIELSAENELTVDGQPMDLYVGRSRRRPGIEESYFNLAARKKAEAESPQTSHRSQEKQEASPKQAESKVLYVSKTQLASREFMLAAGGSITAGIQSGRVKVDDTRAVQSGHEIREFLAPKTVEGAAQTQTEKPPAPKPRTITKAESMNRGFTLKLEQEWASAGGYLKAVQRGDIKIV